MILPQLLEARSSAWKWEPRGANVQVFAERVAPVYAHMSTFQRVGGLGIGEVLKH